jgi:glycosyltransferase involved in cell wall biosynthesis
MGPTVLVTNPNSDLYGASRMMLETVEGFRDEQWRVVVTLPSEGPLVDDVLATGAEFRRCPSPVLRKAYLTPMGLVKLTWEAASAVWPTIRTVRSVRPDVIYVNTVTEPLWLVLAWVLRVPALCHVHEGESSASKLLRTALALPLRLAPSLMVNSRFSLGVLLESSPGLEPRARVVYNGVAGPPLATPARRVLEAPVRLLYVGRLSERKGVFDAVASLVELRRRGVDVTLDMVGSVYPGYEWVEERIRADAAAGGVTDRLRLHGFDPDVWPHLAAADVLLVPSTLDEPFGNTAVEGALAARPMVVTRTSGLLEATEGLTSVSLVEPRRPEGIADAVEAIVATWDTTRDAAQRDAGRAATRFAPAAYRSAVRAMVMELIGRRRRRGVS